MPESSRPACPGASSGLFEPELAGASRAEQRDLLSDAAGLARIALRSDGGHMAPRRADALGAALHGLYWLTANIAARGPVLLAIDDAHWADKPSLRWLAYLVARLEGLPVLVVMTVRPGEPGTPWGAISAIARAGSVVQPSALSCEATGLLVRAMLGEEATAAFCQSCHSATAGNPFRCVASLVELRDQRPTGRHEHRMVTEIHSDGSRARSLPVWRLPEIARELASAIAVFGVLLA